MRLKEMTKPSSDSTLFFLFKVCSLPIDLLAIVMTHTKNIVRNKDKLGYCSLESIVFL